MSTESSIFLASESTFDLVYWALYFSYSTGHIVMVICSWGNFAGKSLQLIDKNVLNYS